MVTRLKKLELCWCYPCPGLEKQEADCACWCVLTEVSVLKRGQPSAWELTRCFYVSSKVLVTAKHRPGGWEGGMLNHAGKKTHPNTKTQPSNTFMLRSLQIKISHGNLNRCSVTRSGHGSRLPSIADPYLFCCGFHSAGSWWWGFQTFCSWEAAAGFLLFQAQGWSFLGAGHSLGTETSAHQLRAWPRAQGRHTQPSNTLSGR